jgi:uncharacterized membrane protein
MAKLERQLREKLAEWTAAGLISPAQAQAIHAREAEQKPGLPWGILIFAGFGAVVIGLGVILLFAYNWDKMHKFAKLGVVFGAMAAAHGTGLYLRRRASLHGFAESAQLLGTMFFGAGIWLVAQIYHISAHYPNAFFVWAAAALLLAWVLPSVAQGLLAAVMLAIWACAEAGSFDNHLAVAPLLVLVGTGWLAWRLRSPVLLAAAAVSFAVSAAAGFCFNGTGIFMVLLGTAVGYGSLAWLTRGYQAFPSAHAILRVAGMVLYFPLLFILTFHDAAEHLLERRGWGCHELATQEWLPMILLPLVALALAVIALRRAAVMRQCHTPEFRARLAAPSFILLAFVACWWLERLTHESHAVEIPGMAIVASATAVFLYHTIANLWRGCRDTRLGSVVGGSLLMAAWVFARYTDLFDSLLARGVMFIVMGAGLFAVAIFYHRLKKQARPAAATTAAPGKED